MPDQLRIAPRLEIHRRGDLHILTSPDDPGLYVAGRSEAQVLDEVAGAIAELREVRGGF